jgi:hypothetical protein
LANPRIGPQVPQTFGRFVDVVDDALSGFARSIFENAFDFLHQYFIFAIFHCISFCRRAT